MKSVIFPPLLFAAVCAAEPVDFNRDVQPILSENCYHCHGPDGGARKADLRLDKKEGAYRTTDGITPVKPGDSAGSDAIVRVLSTDKDEVMPPTKSHRTLTEAQKQLLKRWVEEGAKWGDHWAFVALHELIGYDVGSLSCQNNSGCAERQMLWPRTKVSSTASGPPR